MWKIMNISRESDYLERRRLTPGTQLRTVEFHAWTHNPEELIFQSDFAVRTYYDRLCCDWLENPTDLKPAIFNSNFHVTELVL